MVYIVLPSFTYNQKAGLLWLTGPRAKRLWSESQSEMFLPTRAILLFPHQRKAAVFDPSF